MGNIPVSLAKPEEAMEYVAAFEQVGAVTFVAQVAPE
jgi:hypothetical protein